MYRLTVFVLSAYLVIAVIRGFLGVLPFDPWDIIFQTIFLLFVCHLANKIFSKLLSAVSNTDSTTITALILALIVGPVAFLGQAAFLTLTAFFAIGSKYFLTIRKRHIFNPAGFAVVLIALSGKFGASWWVGSYPLFPIVLLGGLLVLAKIKRFTMVATFFAIYLGLSYLFGIGTTSLAFYTPLVFFATIMLVEPLSSPVETKKQLAYSVLVAGVYVFFQEFSRVGYALELSLIIGNLFFYLLSSPFRTTLTLKRRERLARGTFAFRFTKDTPFTFSPGQFMYWTLPHKSVDQRGIRRYFTISSSPTEKEVFIAVRIPEDSPSSFKKTLKILKKGEKIIAMDVAGDFMLPKDPKTPLVFIAGGIGITPFASMAKWLLDKNEKRNIVILYANPKKEEVAFEALLKEAEKAGVKTHFIFSEKDGHIDQKMIQGKVPDFRKRTFYISGPQAMVGKLSRLVSKMGAKKVKTDFFPGYTETY